MNQLFATLKGVITLDDVTFESIRDSKDAMKRGVLILLVVFLIAGSLQFVFNFVDNVTPFTAEKAADFQNEFLQGMDMWLQFVPEGDEFTQQFLEQFMANFNAGLQMAVEIDAAPTPLPRGISGFFTALGTWASNAFKHLGAWLSYAIWVLLFAKLLGGAGGVDRFLGLTALYAVPSLLGILSPIPWVGGLIAFIGTVWGWIIYFKAVQVSQRFTLGKAILATLLPIIIFVVVIAVISFVGVLGIVSAASQ